ncbi:uncharacterized protein LOC106558622 isoform X3 [Canis lupus familiaris]|uniref:uncharacterized protein LOC106558622 isoform X3 n=1 Tax=Canis lupus familiaris TaxID=9615 RepID=UPI0015F1A78B|nr:uncharacterized protein LOC106558622 isoform X3 [Canis lupus familiaris]XP_038517385.1 uncharacterized protein LOC106558622 isoform X3 [Canis lupus familiaris]
MLEGEHLATCGVWPFQDELHRLSWVATSRPWSWRAASPSQETSSCSGCCPPPDAGAGPTWVCTVATGRSSTLKGQRPMLRSRSLWRVLRRRGGVDRVALEHRVREAMDADPPPYHPTRSNCVHFALRLLGPMPIPDPLQIDSGPINSVSAAQLPLHHLTSPPKPVNKCR